LEGKQADAEAIQEAISAALRDVQEFANTVAFQDLLNELWGLKPENRAAFVRGVILRDLELAARGVVVPDGMKLQRSAFGDDRPTLFCITKYLPAGVLWHKVTITFDNPSGDPAIRYADVADAVTI
jgi:hypothetical protein